MNAQQIENKLRSIEGLRDLKLEPLSVVATPIYKVSGNVFLRGEPYRFETEITITDFRTNDDVARLGAGILGAFEGANRKISKQQSA